MLFPARIFSLTCCFGESAGIYRSRPPALAIFSQGRPSSSATQRLLAGQPSSAQEDRLFFVRFSATTLPDHRRWSLSVFLPPVRLLFHGRPGSPPLDDGVSPDRYDSFLDLVEDCGCPPRGRHVFFFDGRIRLRKGGGALFLFLERCFVVFSFRRRLWWSRFCLFRQGCPTSVDRLFFLLSRSFP